MDLDRIFENKRVIITCGAGGVGKTTLAAAIACRAARLGRNVAVLTIDPARRLASSLGLSDIGDEARAIDVPPLPDYETGRLDAIMLDVRSTFDRLVQRNATTSKQAEAILNNKFYRHFSGAVGGSQEYTAMERLYELSEQDAYDLLVLDTPPTVHALDFLDAPQRLIDAFDESIFRWVIKPYLMAGKVGVQVLSFGSAYIFKTLTRFVGGDMLEDLSEYLLLFQGMYEGFRERARSVQTLLHDPDSRFLVVATAQPSSLQDAALFHRELQRMELPFGGFLINRMLPGPQGELRASEIQARCAAHPDARGLQCDAFIERLVESQQRYAAAARHQQRLVEQFRIGFNPPPELYHAPLLKADVADIEGLLSIGESVREGLA